MGCGSSSTASPPRRGCSATNSTTPLRSVQARPGRSGLAADCGGMGLVRWWSGAGTAGPWRGSRGRRQAGLRCGEQGRRAAASPHRARRDPGTHIAGEFAAAEKRSADIVRDLLSRPVPGLGVGERSAGTVDVARGNFSATVPRMEQTVAALTSEAAASWSFPARLLLTQSYCALGWSNPARRWSPNCGPVQGSMSRCSIPN